MYGIYRQPGFRRLDLGAWYSAGVFYSGYMNHFKNYQRKGIEFFSMPMRRLRWLRQVLDFGFAFFTKPQKPQAWIECDFHWEQMGAIMLIFLWFGVRLHCPTWLHKMARKWKMAKWEKEWEEMSKAMDTCGYPQYED